VGICVGIDGGGTSTRVLALETETLAASMTLGASSRLSSVGWSQAQVILVDLVTDSVQKLGRSLGEVTGLSACLSGVDSPLQAERMSAELKQFFPAAKIEVANDAMAALTAGTLGGPGVVLIGGTGAVAVGEGMNGQVARAGGYGHLIGDEGSGFELGRQGLLAALKYREHRGEYTSLWDAAAGKFQVQHPNAILPIIYDAKNPVSVMASFAEVVIQQAATDDSARAIVATCVAQQAALVQSVFVQLPDVPRQVVLSGGLFAGSDIIVNGLRTRLPETSVQLLKRPAVTGALLRAWRLHEPFSSAPLGEDALNELEARMSNAIS